MCARDLNRNVVHTPHGGSVLAAQFTGVFRYGALIEVLPEDGS